MASVPFRPLLSRSPLSSPPMESELLLSSEGVPPDEAGAIRKRRDDAPERGLKPDRLFLFFVFSPSEPAPSTLCFFSFFHRRKTRRRKKPTFFFAFSPSSPPSPSLSTHAREGVRIIQTPEKQPRPQGKEAAPPLSPGLPFFLSVVASAASSLTGGRMATAMDLGGAEAPAATGAGVSGDDSLYPIAILMSVRNEARE